VNVFERRCFTVGNGASSLRLACSPIPPLEIYTSYGRGKFLSPSSKAIRADCKPYQEQFSHSANTKLQPPKHRPRGANGGRKPLHPALSA
jgi:hypothetical protein